MVWSASEDGTVRQHDLREGASCPPAGSSRQECRNILVSPNSLCVVLNCISCFTQRIKVPYLSYKKIKLQLPHQ